MENTLENKAKFFAQYWNQKIEQVEKGEDRYFVNCNYIVASIVELTPLSQISDEDAVSFFDIVWAKVANHKNKPRDFKISFGKDWAESPLSERYGLIPSGLFHGVDFLRSRGYALPWMGLSVDQLVEYGWIKLKEEQK